MEWIQIFFKDLKRKTKEKLVCFTYFSTYQDDVLDRLDLLDPLAVFPLDSCNFDTDVVTGLFLALSIDVGWDVLDQSLHNCCWDTKIARLLSIHSVSKFLKNIYYFIFKKKISVLQFLPGNLLLNTALYKVSFHLLGGEIEKSFKICNVL